jgi:hypothetical protein
MVQIDKLVFVLTCIQRNRLVWMLVLFIIICISSAVSKEAAALMLDYYYREFVGANFVSEPQIDAAIDWGIIPWFVIPAFMSPIPAGLFVSITSRRDWAVVLSCSATAAVAAVYQLSDATGFVASDGRPLTGIPRLIGLTATAGAYALVGACSGLAIVCFRRLRRQGGILKWKGERRQ